MASEVRKAVSQLTSTESAHRKVLEELRVITGVGSKSSLSPRSPSVDDLNADKSAAYGGYAINPRNKQFENCLYVRLNPPLAQDIPLDTKSKSELSTLRSSTETWLKAEETVSTLIRMAEALQEFERVNSTPVTPSRVEEGVPPTGEPGAEPEPELEPESEQGSESSPSSAVPADGTTDRAA